MPSRSTNAPKSTMFEICPSTTSPGCRRSRICCRCSLRSSSSTARRESTTLLRERLSSITLRAAPAEELVEVLHAADVDERRRQEAAHAEVEDQAALDDLDHPSDHRLADSAAASIFFHASSKRARFFERIRRPRRPPS
jgi:hypothetical protein